jgi:23S rRNA pseudouridine1911/1915/1917 synthase
MTNRLDEVAVILENDSVVVVDKPAGLVVHADGRTKEANLCDWVLDNYPQAAGVGEPIEKKDGSLIKRPGIVHRLDRGTSGALIIARTAEAHADLKRQFKDREVQKEYAAFVYGRLEGWRITVAEPLGRSTGDFRRYAVAPRVRGKTRPARTIFSANISTDEASYITAYPQTGRTHQIRVHLEHLHHPVVCDSLYASGQDCLLGFARQALHARSITFRLPGDREITAEAELPADFIRAKARLDTVG